MVRFYQDDERYADLLNGYVFQGRQVISGKCLEEVDSRKSGKTKQGKRGENKYRQRYSDSVRKMVFGMNCVVIALENQKNISYAMPIRVIDGEAMEYSSQWNKIRRRHKNAKDLSRSSEYLEGFAKNDRLQGVITLVVYYGEEPWDAVRDLYELLDLSGIPEEFKRLVNHYPIHVLEVHRFEHMEWFQTDIREVFGFIQNASNMEELQKFVESRKENFADMEEDACDVIMDVTKTKTIPFKDEKYRNEKGGIDMCKALEDWGNQLKAQAHTEGRAEGHAQGRKEMQHEITIALFNDGAPLDKVIDLFNLDPDLAIQWHKEWCAAQGGL